MIVDIIIFRIVINNREFKVKVALLCIA